MGVDKDSGLRTLDPLDTSTLALKGGFGTKSLGAGPRCFHFIQQMNLGIIQEPAVFWLCSLVRLELDL